MSRKKMLIALTAVALGIAGAVSSAQAGAKDDASDRQSCVVPCSLDGVNPVYHPRIFGNPAFAKDRYGFVQGTDHTWHVMPNCKKPAFLGPCDGR